MKILDAIKTAFGRFFYGRKVRIYIDMKPANPEAWAKSIKSMKPGAV
jgi:hypothetical protein